MTNEKYTNNQSEVKCLSKLKAMLYPLYMEVNATI